MVSGKWPNTQSPKLFFVTPASAGFRAGHTRPLIEPTATPGEPKSAIDQFLN